MDQGLAQKRETNPSEKASILSLLFFTFTARIFRKGLKRELQETDIYEVPRKLKATELGDKLEKAWEIEKQKPKPWVLRPIFKVFGGEWMIYATISFIVNTTSPLYGPLLLGKVVAYFSKGQTEISKETAYMYAGLLMATGVFHTLYGHTFQFRVGQLLIKIKAACYSLIYRKTLKLSAASLKEMTCGRIVTLLTKDLNFVEIAVESFPYMLSGIIQTFVIMYVLYQQVGVPGVFGASVMIMGLPIHMGIGKLISILRKNTSGKTDKRVRITQDILTSMRTIKMYTWERFFTKEVNSIRNQEVRKIKMIYNTKAFALSLGNFTLQLSLYVSIMAYLARGNLLTAEKTYVIMGCLNNLGGLFTDIVPLGFPDIADAIVSLRRITTFLTSSEVSQNQHFQTLPEAKDTNIVLKNVSASPNSETLILKNISLQIKPGLTVITGPVGCGKSTLLKLLLKDVPAIEGLVTINGSISYASQQPWLFPSSIKQNIIFGEPLDEVKYQDVIRVCALRKDLYAFPQGDATGVTDKGCNLSSGQKARINLARAVYKAADIYLLDDSLSSVDSHVGKQIFNECVQNFLKNKIRVLVTHKTQFLEEADAVIVLAQGKVSYCGVYKKFGNRNSIDVVPNVNPKEYEKVNSTKNAVNGGDFDQNATDESSKLLQTSMCPIRQKFVYQEINDEGVVDKHVYKEYARYGGGWKILLVLVALFIVTQVASNWFDYFVSQWVDLQESLSQHIMNGTTDTREYLEEKSSQNTALHMFTGFLFGLTVAMLTRAFVYYRFCSQAAVNIHNTIFNKIINAPMTFFDKNMSGNILNRFSRDLGIIDDILPFTGFECVKTALLVPGVLIMVSTVNAVYLIPSFCLITLAFYARKYYLRSGRSIKRLEGATRSPVIGHLNASIEGLTTIRASKAENILKTEFDTYQDTYNSTQYMQLSTLRAFLLLLDSLGFCYVSMIILSLVTFSSHTGGQVGLAITQALSLTGILQWGVRKWAELETQMTSVERSLEYTKIEPEDKSGERPEKWPSNGKIQYQNVSLRYTKSSEPILRDITFSVEPKQKIGVVGRTGAGKSSILSILFKLYEFEGCIAIDGVDIKTIDLDVLRSNIAIIPQDPVLFTDTLRNNLDPNNKCTDLELWSALEEVEMKNAIADLESGLDIKISDGGANFSIGQKQLLCLSRAILQKSNILVLDEATGNIDLQTDALIQRAIKRNFSSCTVITVAHKLDTILESDQVLVMDSGRVVEYDDPSELLKDNVGAFYGIVKESGLL